MTDDDRSRPAAEAHASEVIEGVHRLPVPTPFPVGSVNAYLLEGDPLTLVDNGPGAMTAMVELGRLLGETGHAVEDLEVLVVTHHHVDHVGLTSALASRSGADVVALGPAADFLEDFERHQAQTDRFARSLLRRHGMPGDAVAMLQAVASVTRGYGSSAKVTKRVSDLERLTLGGREFTVLHRPGHSPSDTVLYDADDGILITGDHILPNISSNALITRLGSGDGEARTRPLLDYRRSLGATRSLDARLVLAGHGPVTGAHRELIERRLAEQAERARLIPDLLSIRPMAAHEVAHAIWGRAALTQAVLTLSEVLGHIDLLMADESVTSSEANGITWFSAL